VTDAPGRLSVTSGQEDGGAVRDSTRALGALPPEPTPLLGQFADGLSFVPLESIAEPGLLAGRAIAGKQAGRGPRP
jgi:hypothetical protein